MKYMSECFSDDIFRSISNSPGSSKSDLADYRGKTAFDSLFKTSLKQRLARADKESEERGSLSVQLFMWMLFPPNVSDSYCNCHNQDC